MIHLRMVDDALGRRRWLLGSPRFGSFGNRLLLLPHRPTSGALTHLGTATHHSWDCKRLWCNNGYCYYYFNTALQQGTHGGWKSLSSYMRTQLSLLCDLLPSSTHEGLHRGPKPTTATEPPRSRAMTPRDSSLRWPRAWIPPPPLRLRYHAGLPKRTTAHTCCGTACKARSDWPFMF